MSHSDRSPDELASHEKARQRAASARAGGGLVSDAVDGDGARRAIVKIAFEQFLGRSPSDDDFANYIGALNAGMPIERFVEEVASSEEAQRRKAGSEAQSVEKTRFVVGEDEQRVVIRLVFNHFLGREPSTDDTEVYLRALKAGMSVAALVDELGHCEEARRRNEAAALAAHSAAGQVLRLDDADLQTIVKLVFNQFLNRDPSRADLDGYTGGLRNGLSPTRFAAEVAESEEARVGNMSRAALDSLSDGEFIQFLGELLFEGGGATPEELEIWKAYLRETRERRTDLVSRLVADRIPRLRAERAAANDPFNCWIMGTKRYLTPEVWKNRASQIPGSRRAAQSPPIVPLEDRTFRHSGEHAVTAIASLYKGRRYLEAFLENISSQTLFDRSELIIIDADSPEGEFEVIKKYQEIYPNIVYKRMNYRIGIYEAWNLGVALARGRYLTNTNLDDLRRRDSFEIQAKTLDQQKFADVVYQDFFYTFDGEIDFERIEEFGFKSELPIVTANNLLLYNPPHNAPMWRSTLHDAVGMFDTSFQSAGDYEFWFRCLSRGKKFYKINTPHVAYFQNPEGISTSSESRGIEEARRLQKIYARKLISPYLSMSRRDFAAALNTEPDWEWETPAFAVVQRELRRLSERS